MHLDRYRPLLQAFTGTLNGLRLYSAQHPACQRQVQKLFTLFEGLLIERSRVRMGLLEGTLFIEDHLFAEVNSAADELVELLECRQVEGLVFLNGLSLPELEIFTGLLNNPDLTGANLDEALLQHSINHIEIQTVDDDDQEPRTVYGNAIKVVTSIMDDVRLGRIPSSTDAKKVVKSMVQVTLSDPHALFALSMLKDYDNYTFTHSVNVSVIAIAVGRACRMDPQELRLLGLGGLLHDVGKLRINLDIINKPARLSHAEFLQVKEHPRLGADIVASMDGITQEVIDIVLAHHLGFDRTGYPEYIRHRSFPRMVDTVTIADAYDAMTTLRAYQRPLTPRKAMEELRQSSGKMLNPQILTPFLETMGAYPVGSLVRLNNNEIGVVTKVSQENPDQAHLKIVFDKEGQLLSEPNDAQVSPSSPRQIVAEVDPFFKGVTVSDYFP